MLMSIPQCITLETIALYDFDWVFHETPVKNCIVGRFLTCHITAARLVFVKNEKQAKDNVQIKHRIEIGGDIILAFVMPRSNIQFKTMGYYFCGSKSNDDDKSLQSKSGING